MDTMQEIFLIHEDEKEKNETIPVPIEQDHKGLSYVPWLECRILLNRHYPDLVVSYKVNSQKINDNLSYCFILLYLENVKTRQVSQTLYYPVMRRGLKKNNEPDFVAVDNPSPLHVNTAIMRGASKLIAIETGLGRSAYRKDKEDLLLDGVFEGIPVPPLTVEQPKREAVPAPAPVQQVKPTVARFNLNKKEGAIY